MLARVQISIIAFVASVIVLAAVPASAQDPDPSLAAVALFVDELIDDAIVILRRKELPVAERESLLAARLRRGFALDYIARFVLGRHWRKATPEQRREYQELFADFIIKSYSVRLDDYTDQTIEVGRAKPAGKKDFIVASKIIRDTGPPLAIDWRVRKRDGVYKVIDLKVEGISMAISQREEFSAVVQREGIEGLIDGLRKRVNSGSAAATDCAATSAPQTADGC